MISFEDQYQHHSYWYDAADCSKFLMIRYNNKIIGRNKFLQLLRYNKIILKDSNQPSQFWINTGLARYHSTQKQWKRFGMCLLSDKGLDMIKSMIREGKLQIGFEKRSNKYLKTINDVC